MESCNWKDTENLKLKQPIKLNNVNGIFYVAKFLQFCLKNMRINIRGFN